MSGRDVTASAGCRNRPVGVPGATRVTLNRLVDAEILTMDVTTDGDRTSAGSPDGARFNLTIDNVTANG